MTRLLVRRFLDDYGRNGANLLLLLLIPITFVLAAASALANAAKLLGGAGGGPAVETVTAGWASAFLAAIAMYFQVSASRRADRRLVTAGAKPRRLGTARLLTGLVLACLASVAALAALAARGDVDDPWRVVAGTIFFAVIYVGLGAAVGALLPSAVNGTVLLLFIWILDVFFGPTLSGTDSPIVRLLPTHFVSLWIVDLPAGHSGLSTLSWSLIWVGGSLTLAFLVVAGHEPHRNPRSLWAHRRPAQMLAALKAGSPEHPFDARPTSERNEAHRPRRGWRPSPDVSSASGDEVALICGKGLGPAQLTQSPRGAPRSPRSFEPLRLRRRARVEPGSNHHSQARSRCCRSRFGFASAFCPVQTVSP